MNSISHDRRKVTKKEEEEQRRAIELTKFLVKQRKDYISRWFTPTWENCTDILDLLSLPFDKFIAKCLCIRDHNINLGNHRSIFFWSVIHCNELLQADKSEYVTRILSHVDLFSAVRSFILVNSYSHWYDDILKVIISDRRTEVLHCLNEFLSTSRDWSHVNPEAASTVFLIAAGSPPQFPSDVDVSSIIAHIGRHPSWEHWREASGASITYLMQCNISELSERVGVHEFLQHCVDRDFCDTNGIPCDTSEATRLAAQTFSNQHQALFNPPPPTAQGASINDAEDVPQSLDQNLSPGLPDPHQSHNPRDVALSSEPDDPPETHIPSIDTPTILAANIALPSEDHELIDMSIPPEPGA
ncbi:hypothetical protein SISNIDRAFT_490402 [Sistotremastrum niveocremeum HHB9708]|uniref:Uncharacterized protein n=1 Tax=Sistotremastrum niveocremeum HHB9708 TaxID=1314777 RepID=A0A164P043_9AGAM|nr:hypothetical protein SISNIDRAFT_490402 [Sistotremastrum niveocremeum HHB9708]